MPIKLVEETNLSAWEMHLKTVPLSPFHSVPWLDSFKDSHSHPVFFRFVSAERTIGIAAGLSLNPVHPRLRKIYRKLFLFSGPVFIQQDHEWQRACLSELFKYATLHQYTHLVIKYYDHPYTMDFGNLPFSKETREEYIIDLNPEWPDIKKSMRKSIIEQTRNAERSGLTFHESHSPELIENLISLLEKTKLRRLGKGYEKYSYYYIPYLNRDVLYRIFQNKIGRIFYVKSNDKNICILFLVAYNSKACALLIGSSEDAYHLRAPAFLWSNTIAQLKTEGFEYLNLGGVPEDSSKSKLIFAKTSLGAKKHLCAGGKTPHLNGRFFNLLNVVYTKMPDMKIKNTVKKLLSGKSY